MADGYPPGGPGVPGFGVPGPCVPGSADPGYSPDAAAYPAGIGPTPTDAEPWSYPTPTTMSRRTKWIIAAAALALVLIVGAVISTFAIVHRGGAASSGTDVTLIGCGLVTIDNGQTVARATVKVTNQGGGTASYVVTVAFESPDGGTTFGHTTATIAHVPSGATVTKAIDTSMTVTQATCELTGSTRQ